MGADAIIASGLMRGKRPAVDRP